MSDYGEGDDGLLFGLGVIVVAVLGISMLISNIIFDLGRWSVFAGFVCIGLTGPFVFTMLGNHVAEPRDRLVYFFGYALPGLAMLAITCVVWKSVGLTTVLARKSWGVAGTFGGVWTTCFLVIGLGRYLALRRAQVEYWYDDDGDLRADRARAVWSSYEWVSLIVAVVGSATSVVSVLMTIK